MIAVGTSGYNYPEWRGSFYPEGLGASKMLAYYAERFSTVEVNYTFYRMPTEKILAGWAAGTPDGFSFSLKAPRRITHVARLRGADDAIAYFVKTARTLGPKLGVILFQLPPFLKKDLEALDAFLALLPDGLRSAFEFRNPTWLEDDVFERLRRRNVALCIADGNTSQKKGKKSAVTSTPAVATADYGYLRLRDEGYDEPALAEWAELVRSQRGWKDAFVYFKHEEQGRGPELANLLRKHLPEASPGRG